MRGYMITVTKEMNQHNFTFNVYTSSWDRLPDTFVINLEDKITDLIRECVSNVLDNNFELTREHESTLVTDKQFIEVSDAYGLDYSSEEEK